MSRESNTLPISGVVANDSTIKVAARLDGLAGRAGNYWGDNILLENFVTPYYGPVKVFAVKPGTSSVAFQRQSLSRTVLMPPATQTFTYDADGNLTADGLWTYTWDAENRLTSVTPINATPGNGPALNSLRFAYDYMGRRIVKEVSGTSGVISERRYIYDGWNLIAELAASSGSFSLVRTYTWGLDIARSLTKAGGVGQLVQVADHATSKAMFATYDGNGNVAALIDGASSASGALMAAYEYSSYGEFLRCEGTYAKENPFRFSTKFTDDETGLVYYGKRYYQPANGRFLGRDPKGEQGGTHLYAFTTNKPINRWDYLGMMMAAVSTGRQRTRREEIDGCIWEIDESEVGDVEGYGGEVWEETGRIKLWCRPNSDDSPDPAEGGTCGSNQTGSSVQALSESSGKTSFGHVKTDKREFAREAIKFPIDGQPSAPVPTDTHQALAAPVAAGAIIIGGVVITAAQLAAVGGVACLVIPSCRDALVDAAKASADIARKAAARAACEAGYAADVARCAAIGCYDKRAAAICYQEAMNARIRCLEAAGL